MWLRPFGRVTASLRRIIAIRWFILKSKRAILCFQTLKRTSSYTWSATWCKNVVKRTYTDLFFYYLSLSSCDRSHRWNRKILCGGGEAPGPLFIFSQQSCDSYVYTPCSLIGHGRGRALTGLLTLKRVITHVHTLQCIFTNKSSYGG